MPCRIRISLAVQQMPAMLIPLAPLALAPASSSRIAAGRHHHVGQGRFVAVDQDVHLLLLRARRGWRASASACGPPNSTSGHVGGDHRAAPAVGQRGPHAEPAAGARRRFHAHVGACACRSTTSRSMPRGETVDRGPILLLLLGGPCDGISKAPSCRPNSASSKRPKSPAICCRCGLRRRCHIPPPALRALRDAADLVNVGLALRPPRARRGPPRAVIGVGRRARRRCRGAGCGPRSRRPWPRRCPLGGRSPKGSMRQGPMKQLRQQIPSLPKPHWGCWLASGPRPSCSPGRAARGPSFPARRDRPNARLSWIMKISS